MTTPTQDRELLTRAINCLEILDKRPRPMCRDCADCEGICCNDGLDCNMRKLIADCRSIIAQPAAIGVADLSVKQQYDEIMAGSSEDQNALEDLRFFCSLAMRGQDWLDVEPFFDALAAPKSVTVAQGEQQWKYVVDALVAGGFVSREKVDQAIAIYRTVAHPAASTGAVRVSNHLSS